MAFSVDDGPWQLGTSGDGLFDDLDRGPADRAADRPAARHPHARGPGRRRRGQRRLDLDDVRRQVASLIQRAAPSTVGAGPWVVHRDAGSGAPSRRLFLKVVGALPATAWLDALPGCSASDPRYLTDTERRVLDRMRERGVPGR